MVGALMGLWSHVLIDANEGMEGLVTFTSYYNHELHKVHLSSDMDRYYSQRAGKKRAKKTLLQQWNLLASQKLCINGHQMQLTKYDNHDRFRWICNSRNVLLLVNDAITQKTFV